MVGYELVLLEVALLAGAAAFIYLTGRRRALKVNAIYAKLAALDDKEEKLLMQIDTKKACREAVRRENAASALDKTLRKLEEELQAKEQRSSKPQARS
ncbi:hypothetical protein GCM10011385_03430 [Nitratireductor aestuarii]|uniref:Uncharacterized protein n=1 Tax=Nitratireductor aestuarii TaxID=1735103 RepID=A0A916VYH1_9HYPH|nr:hypothetical protein [Nitratireductor aestuarii]GGA53331.1 hypothetical protein GCM10011385_03430 [Nitratireductor aestuarii]